MKRQGGFIPPFLLPYLWKALGAIAILIVLGILVHKYNEHIRAPLKKEIKFLENSNEANKVRAAQLLAQREADNKKAVEGYIELARKSDEEFAAKDAQYRKFLNGPSRVREHTGCGAGSTAPGQTGEGSTAAPEKAAAGEGAVPKAREFIVGEADVAMVLSWYVQAESCIRFANSK